jgi:pSer/pThr/pTyr-binding forkhead associated (FHA) protein
VVVSGEELRVFDLPREGSRTIGRAEGNQIRIDHPSVSRWHAVLEFGASIAIEDLGGSNGTFIREATS